MYELTCTPSPTTFTPHYNNDLDALLASLERPRYDLALQRPPSLSLECTPRRSWGSDYREPLVYHVSEDIPVDAILRHFGVDSYNMRSSVPSINHFQPISTPIIQRLPPSVPGRRYLVCQEVTEMGPGGGDDYRRPVPYYDHEMHRNPFPDPMPPSSTNVHNLLNRVWNRALSATDRPSSPNFNPSWQGGMSPNPRDAVDHVWQRARFANDRPMDFPPTSFNRMGHPPNNFPPLIPPSSPLNIPPSPMDNNWNRPDYPRPPISPRPGPSTLPPPPTLGTLLSQAYRSRIPPSRLPNTFS